jgi:acetyl esterase/lipase
MIICPGGGYWNLAIDLEGEEVAARFNEAGITGIVLKYRVPRRPGQPEPLPAPGPLLDAQRAVSLVRSRAAEWGINPSRIGIGGFSAGAHLALTTATHFDKRAYEPIDAVDKVSCRPDFAVLAYPGYLVDIETWEQKPWVRIPPQTPPVFFVHASDDSERGASSAHSAVTYLALKKAGVPSELHIYLKGEHGFGVRKNTVPGADWPNRCLDWLRTLDLLKSRKR